MLYSFFMPAAKMKERLATQYVTFVALFLMYTLINLLRARKKISLILL